MQFDREAAVVIGDPITGLVVRNQGDRGLRFSFSVVRTSTAQPPKMELTITNLGSKSRGTLDGLFDVLDPAVDIQIAAGYKRRFGTGGGRLIFQGQAYRLEHKRQRVDWQTTISSQDGRSIYQKALNEVIGPGASALRVFQMMTAAGGARLNPKDAAKVFAHPGDPITVYDGGFTMGGQWRDEMEAFARTHRFEFSVDGGELRMWRIDDVLAEKAIVLTPKSGLIGSPVSTENGGIRVKSLLQPEIRPGRQIFVSTDTERDVVSLAIRAKATGDGFYRVHTVRHTGDTTSGAWYSETEAQPVFGLGGGPDLTPTQKIAFAEAVLETQAKIDAARGIGG